MRLATDNRTGDGYFSLCEKQGQMHLERVREVGWSTRVTPADLLPGYAGYSRATGGGECCQTERSEFEGSRFRGLKSGE